MLLGHVVKEEGYYKGKCSSCLKFTGYLVDGDTRCASCIIDEENEDYLIKIKNNEIQSKNTET